MYFRISGTGSYLPEKILTNDDLSQMVDTNDEWIVQRVGISRRHVSVNESAADMAVKAAEAALENSGVKAEELDLIIAATISNDGVCPTVAGWVEKMLGANCPAFDVSSACSGFIFALDTAAGFFARGGVKKALVLGAERISKLVDWTDRSTCVIFGDGAGAAVLESCGEDEGFMTSVLHTQGGDDVIDIPLHPGLSPFYEKEEPKLGIKMEGQATFKFAVNSFVHDVTDVCTRCGITPADLDWLVPHQANIRIIQMAAKKLGLPTEKLYTNIAEVGNISAASVPCALDWLNRSGKLKRGDKIALAAFGGGLSSGAVFMQW